MEKVRIYVAFHQNGKVLSNEKVYVPLQVGRAISQLGLDMEHDATGNNISERNDIYSELTGWYWIWKNRRHEFVGTGHYRRYFTIEPPSVVRRISKVLLFLIGLQKKRKGLFYVNNTLQSRKKI